MPKEDFELFESMGQGDPCVCWTFSSMRSFHESGLFTSSAVTWIVCKFGRAALMLKKEPQLLENTCKVTQVLELDELKNPDCLPVLP